MDYGDLISRIKYKPDWIFYHVRDEWGQWLQIHAKVIDSRTLAPEPVLFTFNRLIPTLPDEKLFLGWVKTVLVEAEIHELREFFRFDGELVDDPHAVQAVAA